MATKKRSKSKGLGSGWAAKNIERVEHAATSQLEKLDEARRALDKQRAAMAQGQGGPSTKVALADIATHGQTQPRVAMDEQTWREYATRMEWSSELGLVVDPEGQHWPALQLVHDGQTLWLADGFHRLHAARSLGLEFFQAHIEPGTQREAVQRSLGANARHGKRRTRADKRRAIERALFDVQWATWTDARVARLCHVTPSMVTNVRQALEGAGTIIAQEILVGEDGREFERSVTPRAVTPKKEAKRPSPPTSSRPAPASRDRSGPSQMSWDAFASQDICPPNVVAYPAEPAHWRALVERVSAAGASSGVVVVPVPSGTDWMWRGPKALDVLVSEHGFEHPELIHISRFSRAYFVWRKDAPLDVEAWLARPHTSWVVVGPSLDEWSVP